MRALAVSVLVGLALIAAAMVYNGERANDTALFRAGCENRISLFNASDEDIDSLSATAVAKFKRCMR